jgi:hypothetical protein
MNRMKPFWQRYVATGLIVLLTSPAVAECPRAAAKPAAGDAQRGAAADLPALMARHKPPYVRPEGPPDKSITFERVDVLIEPVLSRLPTAYLSIGRDGSYLYNVETVDLPDGKQRLGARLVARMPLPRFKELERLLEATQWLAAAGGEGPATHTDAGRMTVALTRDGKTRTSKWDGNRPAPYTALQKFFYDLALQEDIYHRLTFLPDEQRQAIRDLHEAIESALRRPGHGAPQNEINFERYQSLFAAALDDWYVKETDELRAAVDLMLLLKRPDHADAIARLRNDRDLNMHTTVAQALPALMGEKAIPLLEQMIESTQEARLGLIGLGEPAVETIAAIIERDETAVGLRSVGLIRAYIDHWKELPQPIDPRVIAAVKHNMQLEKVRDRGFAYHRELLKLAGEPEPKDPTALETAQSWLKHLQAGDEAALQRVVSNVAKTEDWLKLRESFAPAAELVLEKLYIDKTSGLMMTKPFKNKAGEEIRLFVFMNLLRGTDWRVGPALAQPAQKTLYRDRFLQSNPEAKEIIR